MEKKRKASTVKEKNNKITKEEKSEVKKEIKKCEAFEKGRHGPALKKEHVTQLSSQVSQCYL